MGGQHISFVTTQLPEGLCSIQGLPQDFQGPSPAILQDHQHRSRCQLHTVSGRGHLCVMGNKGAGAEMMKLWGWVPSIQASHVLHGMGRNLAKLRFKQLNPRWNVVE